MESPTAFTARKKFWLHVTEHSALTDFDIPPPDLILLSNPLQNLRYDPPGPQVSGSILPITDVSLSGPNFEFRHSLPSII